MDPNEVVGIPTEREMWLSPDWTKKGASAAAVGPGSTKVTVRTVTYRNGRQVTYVLDENHEPVKHPDGTYAPALAETVDPDVKRVWDSAQDDAKPPGGLTTKTVNGAVMQWNPQTRAYDIPTGQAPAPTSPSAKPAGSKTQVEGTPDPSKPGGFDNERPVMVTRGPDGKVILSEPLTPAEKKQWDEERQQSRNPGGKTDAQIETERRQKEADDRAAADRNKPGAPTIKPDGKGGSIAVQTMPDGSIKTTPLPGVPSDKPNPERVTVNGTIYERGADGTYAPAKGLPDAKSSGKLPADAPKLDLTNAQTARTSFMTLMSYVDNMRRTGQLTAEEAKDILSIPHAQVTDMIGQETTATTQANTVRDDRLAQNRDLESQRSNRAGEAGRMFSNAAQAAGTPGAVRGDLTPGYMTLQARMAQASGANNVQPEVDIPGAISIKPPARPTSELGQPGDPPMTGGPLPKPLLAPAPPVSAATASAAAAQGRATATGGTPTAGEPGGPPLAAGPVAPTPGVRPTAPAASVAAAAASPGSEDALLQQAQAAAMPAADGNERPDDILTIYNPQSQQTVTMTRAKFMEFAPEARAQVVVQNAAGAGMPAAAPVNAKPDTGVPGNPDYQPGLPPGTSIVPQPPAEPPLRPWNGFPQVPDTGGGAGGNVQMAPQDQVGAVASYGGPSSMEDRVPQFKAEGYTEEEIREAQRRVLARYTGAAA